MSGYTHNFYKYPARFSPKFVRAAIETFSAPGDLVIDPFVGGGTTLVEALALGRDAIGTDISSLATFVTTVKTTLLAEPELMSITRWVRRLPERVHMHGQVGQFGTHLESDYYRHLNTARTWRLRKAIDQVLAAAIGLGSPHLEAFARCVLLRTAQWALDARKKLPTVTEFRDRLVAYGLEMIAGARELRMAVEAHGSTRPIKVRCHHLPAAKITECFVSHGTKPRLVLTSPPYPGIHVLYHRWQVDGRKETPAPFLIANKLDGSGAAYYTMGDRKAAALSTYFDQLQAALVAVANLCDDATTVVQVVAFSDPSWQLPRYLEATQAAGLEEFRLPMLASERDGRLWRTVPNRRWHADQLGPTAASQEVVLLFRSSVRSV